MASQWLGLGLGQVRLHNGNNMFGVATTSRTATLSWDPPPYEGQNGVIRKYVLTVNRSDTSFFAELTTTSTQLTVGSLFPFRNYLFTVAAETIEPPQRSIS